MNLSDKEQDGVVIITITGKIIGGPDATVVHDKIKDFIEQNKKSSS